MAFGRGNPGRPKGARNRATSPLDGVTAQWIFRELAGSGGAAYAKILHAIATTHPDPQVQLKAISLIAPYIWQRLPERHELTGLEGRELVIRWQSADA